MAVIKDLKKVLWFFLFYYNCITKEKVCNNLKWNKHNYFLKSN